MEFITVKRDMSEWEYMWLWLELHPINEGLEEPRTATYEGESWQYMGSYKNKEQVVHEFRHRMHPKTLGKYTLNLSASSTFTDNQIEERKKIK